MDTLIQALVDTHSLKMNIWNEAAHAHAKPHIFVDKLIDAVMVMVVDPRTPKITHFVDEHVALLYIEESREVVGFRIEGFEKSFLPKYASLQKAWKLSDISKELTVVGDLQITATRLQLANELTNVTRPIIANKAGMKVPEYAFA